MSAPRSKLFTVAPEVNVEGAAVTVKHGKVVISIKEGKDIYIFVCKFIYKYLCSTKTDYTFIFCICQYLL